MRFIALTVVFLLASCSTTGPEPGYDAYFDDAPPVLLEGLATSGHTIVSTSPSAQAWFDQGVALCWGFNFPEAVRAFQSVIQGDPDCAIAYWGIAYALGPDPFAAEITDESAERAYRAAQEALARIERATDLERALIDAIAERYAWPQPDDRIELDRAYADAMRDVYRRFPDSAFIGTLCAEAVMHLDRSWANWGTDEVRGPITIEVIEILEDVIEHAPDYPGAHHLYIHMVESSDRPERALDSARKLESLMPGAGHLVHMPGHIYIRLGMYDEAIATNERAIDADDRYFRLAPGSFTPYQGLFVHNYHFLIWAAMFRGSFEQAISSAREMQQRMPTDPEFGEAGYYDFVPIHVLMRFGRWEQILAEPAPSDVYPGSAALWRHARAIAYANLGRFAEARNEAAAFEDVVAELSSDADILWFSRDDMLAVARGMMWGEILFKEGDAEAAFASLRRAIEVEDGLPYSEPPAWMQPVRHAYGALLLDAGRRAEAEQAYREDLERFANNVWSLHGLEECLRRQGRQDEALVVEEQFRKASRHADVLIQASCFCGAE